MFDKLHVMYIISFIHLLEIHLFTYSLKLFIYLSDQTFIHLTLNIIYFVLFFNKN